MKRFFIRMLILFVLFSAGGRAETEKKTAAAAFTIEQTPLERNGIPLHLDCMVMTGTDPQQHILLIHGVTYSSHEFDVNYEDYSLARFLAGNGYAVWRLDIAGFGQSGAVEDGFMPDSDYAAEDICAAVETILARTGEEKMDLLGWSWGTVTSGRFAAQHPEYVRKLILYAPILSGVGPAEVTEAFHRNTWEHAVEDFQMDVDGRLDLSVTDPVVVEMFCSGCWHYDRETSPNGGRRDILVDWTERLIDLDALRMPTLIICGSRDPYMNYDLVYASPERLKEGSELKVIEGGGHAVMIEKPFYHEFQSSVLAFLHDRTGEKPPENETRKSEKDRK